MAGIKRIGVLLAAGRSTRMGRPKQLLPWPPNAPDAKPLVAAAFNAIARVCDEMIVVVGHYAEEVVGALGDERTFHQVQGDLGPDLFESIRLGLEAAVRLERSATVLLQPADHPQVRLDTLKMLLLHVDVSPARAVMPTYREKGGHPVCLPMLVIDRVVDYSGTGGLRWFWQENPEWCLRLPVDDPGVVLDIDTQLDYDLGVQ